MLHIERLSRAYRVRRLTEEDTAQILTLCRSNPLYYRHCGTEPSEADIRQDMTLLPPGAAPEDKYFLGSFHGDRRAAGLDLIDGYPSAENGLYRPVYGRRPLLRSGYRLPLGGRTAGRTEDRRLFPGAAGISEGQPPVHTVLDKKRLSAGGGEAASLRHHAGGGSEFVFFRESLLIY